MTQSNIKQVITDKAPTPIGPYSQAVRAGFYLFIGGQIPIDPTTNTLVQGSIQEQTRQVIKNLKAILAEEKLTLEHVVKADVFLKNLNDFDEMNNVYAEEFSYVIQPARVTVQVSRLPLDSLIEIACIAFLRS